MPVGDSRARVMALAAKAGAVAGIDQGHLEAGEHIGLGHMASRLAPNGEGRRTRFAWPVLDRSFFGEPFAQPAIQYRDLTGAVLAQEPPAARGAVQGRMVINDDTIAAANAERFHGDAEIGRGLERGKVKEAGARDMPCLERGAQVGRLAGRGEAGIEDDEIRRAERLREPVG